MWSSVYSLLHCKVCLRWLGRRCVEDTRCGGQCQSKRRTFHKKIKQTANGQALRRAPTLHHYQPGRELRTNVVVDCNCKRRERPRASRRRPQWHPAGAVPAAARRGLASSRAPSVAVCRAGSGTYHSLAVLRSLPRTGDCL